MKKYRIVCVCRMYNELKKGVLEHFLKYTGPLADALVVYDGGSTDGTYEYMLHRTPYVIRGDKKTLRNGDHCNKLLVKKALQLAPDFILLLDAGELLTANAAELLQPLCDFCQKKGAKALSFQVLHIWRSQTWRRVDGFFGEMWSPRLWRITPDITTEGFRAFGGCSPAEQVHAVKVLNYGFASEGMLAFSGYEALERLINEERLKVEKVPGDLLPAELRADEIRPRPVYFEETLSLLEKQRGEVFRPSYSIICPIHKNTKWLMFIYRQVLKYTDLTDKEFFFVASNPSQEVLACLRDNYIDHYVLENTPEAKTGWHINQIYRAYNFGAGKARGHFLVFIHSDMGFNPVWFNNLVRAFTGSNCVSSRLVESGKFPSGEYGLTMDFGRNPDSYDNPGFVRYASEIALPKVEKGGLYVPLLISKKHFDMAGGYPEGNIAPGSDIFNPVIARKGEPCVVGYEVFRSKLATIGVIHQTAFDSVVYHFQNGESGDTGHRPGFSGRTGNFGGIVPAYAAKYLKRTETKDRGCIASIIITTFRRSNLLKWGLYSLARQKIPFKFETIVINDGIEDETEEICRQYRYRLNLKYFFTGHRNLGGETRWRTPGFAVNIGAKQSSGEILIITSSDMYHLNDTIQLLTNPLLEDSNLLGIPLGKDDQDGAYLEHLQKSNDESGNSLYDACSELNIYLPFLMSVSRDRFFAIGGYDEDFTGIAYDDNDLVQRLLSVGCRYFQTKAKTVHLFHPRIWIGREVDQEFLYNRNLYFARRGKIIRNINREWGKL